jgi:hypothetical protein
MTTVPGPIVARGENQASGPCLCETPGPDLIGSDSRDKVVYSLFACFRNPAGENLNPCERLAGFCLVVVKNNAVKTAHREGDIENHPTVAPGAPNYEVRHSAPSLFTSAVPMNGSAVACPA